MKISAKLEEKYHDSVASFYTKRRKHDYNWEVPEEVFLLDKSLFKPKIRVLDMGCGPAISIRRVLGESILNKILYTGVDVSREMLKVAKTNISNGKFIHGDMSEIIFPTHKFDILISLGALHHCENKYTTLKNWLRFIKPGGLLLLREPIYEFLKRGTGESPIEEGIEVNNFFVYLETRKLRIVKLTFFSTNAFHLFNRIMIRLGLKSWQNIRLFWYPVVYIDAFLAQFSKHANIFRPQAFTIILQKP